MKKAKLKSVTSYENGSWRVAMENLSDEDLDKLRSFVNKLNEEKPKDSHVRGVFQEDDEESVFVRGEN